MSAQSRQSHTVEVGRIGSVAQHRLPLGDSRCQVRPDLAQASRALAKLSTVEAESAGIRAATLDF